MLVRNILDSSEPRPKQNRRPELLKHTNDRSFGNIVAFNLDKPGREPFGLSSTSASINKTVPSRRHILGSKIFKEQLL